MDDHIKVIIFWILVGDITAVLAFALIAYLRLNKFMRVAEMAKAEVKKLYRDAKGNAVMDVRFEDTYGVMREATAKAPPISTDVIAKAHRNNTEVAILYNRDAWHEIRVDSFTGVWMLPLLLFHSAIFAAIALGVLIYLDMAAPS